MTGHPVMWSPDGKQIIASVIREAGDGTFFKVVARLANRDGSGSTKLLMRELDEINDWSGDGQWFAVVTKREPPFGRGYQLYRMRPDGTEELRLTKDGLNCYPRFSPDSQKILYLHQTAKDGNSLHVVDLDGKNDREILREEGVVGVESGCWSPDGRRLAVQRANYQPGGKRLYAKPGESNWWLEIMDTDGTNRRKLSLVGAKIIWVDQPDWR